MNNKKLVLVVNTAWCMFNFRYGLLNRLIHDGYQLTIISARDEFSDKLRAMGCEVIDILIAAKGTNPLQDLKLINTLYQLYQKIAPDFIIHYTIKPNIYGSLAAKWAGIPSIAITTGLGYTFVNDNLVAKVARCLYKLAFHFPKEVWFLNEDDRQVFLKHQLITENKAVLLHGEGVDLMHFAPQSKVDNDGKMRFLLSARMLWDKGVGEYVEAARIVRQKYPQAIFQLLGACDVANPSVIKREQIAKWEQAGLVEYLGTTSDVRPIIANADCVVLPSFYREGVPRTLMEAAAMSKPLITTDNVGCRDVVLPDQTGYLCPVKDAAALAACCEKIIVMSPEARAEMGAAGRCFMRDTFDEQLVIEQYLATLKKYGVQQHPVE
ncbi:glycosyltransferase family 4 protein [Aeromonas veronii]|uniref:glycosyltransferase family 4 protein n=1 Tax=Aeromonas veronii TaxID=654 RepID=UPI0007BC2661|nr:glycosyltransferase family 4 protein [Aeromonas veronii]KZW95464.1 glycosyl transferase [Aeromonas veronii]MBL0623809.1 glycosyltransferase family 4 protein [Aeromonas veronii]MCF5884422.1 glycosyltransferase family 4 protein [Aeromonas veronii]